MVRSFEPKKGFFDLPGGFVELNESLEESAKRELKEEIGVLVEDLKYIGSYQDKYLYQDINLDSLSAIFTGNVGNQEIKPSDDVSGFKWIDKDKIPYDRIAFESMRSALKDYLKSSS